MEIVKDPISKSKNIYHLKKSSFWRLKLIALNSTLLDQNPTLQDLLESTHLLLKEEGFDKFQREQAADFVFSMFSTPQQIRDRRRMRFLINGHLAKVTNLV